MVEPPGGQLDGLLVGWRDGQMNRRSCRSDEQTDVSMDGQTDGLTDGCTEGWLREWTCRFSQAISFALLLVYALNPTVLHCPICYFFYFCHNDKYFMELVIMMNELVPISNEF